MGVVKTNAYVLGSNSGGGANSTDLPTHLSSISANGGNGFVTLTLGYTNTTYISGVQVNYKTGSYPTSPSDGQSLNVSGAATSVKIMGLTNTLTYYFRVFLYNEIGGNKYYQTDITNARVTGTPRGVEISGITPLVSTADYIVIVTSSTFTLTAPKGTRIILGSGAGADLGGYVLDTTLPTDINAQTCTLTLGAAYGNSSRFNASTFKIGTKTYSSGSTRQVIQSKWGPIGGNGGTAFSKNNGDLSDPILPTGAGGGGGGYYFNRCGQRGGNYIYPSQNYGGDGGFRNSTVKTGTDGASGKAQTDDDSQYGDGGGGGYSAGGGKGAYSYDVDEGSARGNTGGAGAGILVIECP